MRLGVESDFLAGLIDLSGRLLRDVAGEQERVAVVFQLAGSPWFKSRVGGTN